MASRLEPSAPVPQSYSPVAAASCCRAASGRATRCMLSSTRSWSPSGIWTRDLSRDAVLTSRPPTSRRPCRTLRSSHIAGKKRKTPNGQIVSPKSSNIINIITKIKVCFTPTPPPPKKSYGEGLSSTAISVLLKIAALLYHCIFTSLILYPSFTLLLYQ